MIPISLLGVPLSRSSALWRMAGLSYEEAIHVHRWLGVLTMLLTSFHTLGYLVLWLHTSFESLIEELFSAKGVGGLSPWCVDGEFGGDYVECGGVSNLAGLIACGSWSKPPPWRWCPLGSASHRATPGLLGLLTAPRIGPNGRLRCSREARAEVPDSAAFHPPGGGRACSYGCHPSSVCAARTTCASYSFTSCTTCSSPSPQPTGVAQRCQTSAFSSGPSSAFAPPRDAPDGAARLTPPRGEAGTHWAGSHGLGCSRQPPPKSPISPRLVTKNLCRLHYALYSLLTIDCLLPGTCVIYIMPSAIFYAADLVLRAHGNHACSFATVRAHTHGASHGEPSTQAA